MDRLHKFDDSIFDGIVKTQAYFDSVKFRLTSKLMFSHFINSFLIDELRDLNGTGEVNLVRIPMPFTKGDYTDFVLDIKQATADALACLEHRVKYAEPVEVGYTEIALDHVFETVEEANRFQILLVQSLIQGNNKYPLVVSNQRTAYTKRKFEDGRRSDRNITIYSHEPARLLDNKPPCCHFEVRFVKGPNLTNMGLIAPTDLIGFDFKSFFARTLTLYDICNEEALQNLVLAVLEKQNDSSQWWLSRFKTKSGKVFERDLRKGFLRTLLNTASVDLFGEEVISAHNLRLASDFWNVRLPYVQEDKNVIKRITHKRYRPEAESLFDKGIFAQIDNRRMLDNLESFYAGA